MRRMMWNTFIAVWWMVISVQGEEPSQSVCVSGFCLPKAYNQLEMPPGQSNIRVDLSILDILSVNDKDFSISIYAYLGIRWPEPRLVDESGKNWSTLEMPFTLDPGFVR